MTPERRQAGAGPFRPLAPAGLRGTRAAEDATSADQVGPSPDTESDRGAPLGSSPQDGQAHSRGKPLCRLAAWGLTVLGGVAVLTLAGAAYQEIATRADRRKYPAPGRLFNVDGFRLHLREMGKEQAGPTVILEPGLGATSTAWRRVQPQVARFAPVVAYDRAGLGWSDTSPGPQDARRAVRRLHSLLEQAGISGPYVLVGHSLGGLHARMYAASYPDEVAGLVLIDASHPDQETRMPARLVAADRAWFRRVLYAPFLVILGFPRLRPATPQGGSGLPPHEEGAEQAFDLSLRHRLAMRAEVLGWDRTLAQVRRTASLGDRPLVVLSSTEPSGEGMPEWHTLQAELARLSTRGVYRAVAGADHQSLLSRAEYAHITVMAIREVVNGARGRRYPSRSTPVQ